MINPVIWSFMYELIATLIVGGALFFGIMWAVPLAEAAGGMTGGPFEQLQIHGSELRDATKNLTSDWFDGMAAQIPGR